MGSSSPVTDISWVGNMEFTALITALEVKVAPETTSTPSKGPFLPMNWLRKASSVQGAAIAAVSPEASTAIVAMAPSSFRVMVTFTSDSRPFAEAVISAAAGASVGISTSATATPMAALAASITALEVTVAPESASIPSPRSGVAFLPMN